MATNTHNIPPPQLYAVCNSHAKNKRKEADLVALPGLEPGLFALRGRRVNQLHHNAKSLTCRRLFPPAPFRSIASTLPKLNHSASRFRCPILRSLCARKTLTQFRTGGRDLQTELFDLVVVVLPVKNVPLLRAFQ